MTDQKQRRPSSRKKTLANHALRTHRHQLRRRKLQRNSAWHRRLEATAVFAMFAFVCVSLVFRHFCLRHALVVDGGLEISLPLERQSDKSKNTKRLTDRRKVIDSPTVARSNQHTTNNTIDRDSENVLRNKAFLIFRFPNHSGQGTGNILSGALAAQLLAEEFNRTLCHAGQEPTNDPKSIAWSIVPTNVRSSFRRAFEWRDRRHEETCNQILQSNLRRKTIVQRNYDATSEQSECDMRDLLSNHKDFPIVYYEGNTYPRWPIKDISMPRDYFHETFQPTQALWDILPWGESEPPPIVVHLREGDDRSDQRGGLDNQTLSLLAKENLWKDDNSKPNSPVFLVTNNVEWYSKFPSWSHPNWSLVRHSALKRISWGTHANNNFHNDTQGQLQMWADWYTLLNAKKIYHTFSDFSLSAARWNENIQSWTILGASDDKATTEENKNTDSRLLLRKDFDVPNNVSPLSSHGVPRLVDRITKELWFCGKPSPEEARHVQEKEKRQLMERLRRWKQRESSSD